MDHQRMFSLLAACTFALTAGQALPKEAAPPETAKETVEGSVQQGAAAPRSGEARGSMADMAMLAGRNGRAVTDGEHLAAAACDAGDLRYDGEGAMGARLQLARRGTAARAPLCLTLTMAAAA